MIRGNSGYHYFASVPIRVDLWLKKMFSHYVKNGTEYGIRGKKVL